MASAEANAFILRRVALTALAEARVAWKKADKSPSEENVRAAFYACVFATRALLRASSENPDDEEMMIDKSMVLREVAHGLNMKLARIVEGDPG